MGLDMYLSKKTYVKNWDHQDEKEKHVITVKRGWKNRADIKPERIKYIEEEVGYWRKANHIHRWFVDNVQDGEDDCKEYYVSKQQLEQLAAACKKVLKNPEKAKDILPTQNGFFFGGTEYDEWYMQSLKETVEIIDGLLGEREEGKNYLQGDIYYQSSW